MKTETIIVDGKETQVVVKFPDDENIDYFLSTENTTKEDLEKTMEIPIIDGDNNE